MSGGNAGGAKSAPQTRSCGISDQSVAPVRHSPDASLSTARRSSPARTSALVSTLHSIFGDFEPKVLAMVLFAHDHDLEQAVNALLNLDTSDAQHENKMDADDTPAQQAQHKYRSRGPGWRQRSSAGVQGHCRATTFDDIYRRTPQNCADSSAAKPVRASAAHAAACAARRHTRACLARKVKLPLDFLTLRTHNVATDGMDTQSMAHSSSSNARGGSQMTPLQSPSGHPTVSIESGNRARLQFSLAESVDRCNELFERGIVTLDEHGSLMELLMQRFGKGKRTRAFVSRVKNIYGGAGSKSAKAASFGLFDGASDSESNLFDDSPDTARGVRPRHASADDASRKQHAIDGMYEAEITYAASACNNRLSDDGLRDVEGNNNDNALAHDDFGVDPMPCSSGSDSNNSEDDVGDAAEKSLFGAAGVRACARSLRRSVSVDTNVSARPRLLHLGATVARAAADDDDTRTDEDDVKGKDGGFEVEQARAAATLRRTDVSGAGADRCGTFVLGISLHEWSMLVLAAKRLRPALSVRILERVTVETHTEYVILVVDVVTGSSWHIKRRFSQFFQLRKDILRWLPDLRDVPFPQRRAVRSWSTAAESALTAERQPLLETFLRTVALQARMQLPSNDTGGAKPLGPAVDSAITPFTCLRGRALHELQEFLEVNRRVDSLLMQRNGGPTSACTAVWLHHLLNDPMAPEGRACDRFVAAFRPVTVQSVTSPRAPATTADNGDSQTDADIDAASMEHDKQESVEATLNHMGDFFDGMQQYILSKHRDALRDMLRPAEAPILPCSRTLSSVSPSCSSPTNRTSNFAQSSPGTEFTTVADDEQTSQAERIERQLSELVRSQVELTLFVPLMGQLDTFLRSHLQIDDANLCAKLRLLRPQPQSFFDIPAHAISLSSWQSAIDDINTVDQLLLPSHKLRALVTAMNKIHKVHREEQRQRGNHDPKALGADECLPILVWCVVHSELEKPCSTLQLLTALCNPDKRMSEIGYCLSTFEAALAHINMLESTSYLMYS